LDIIETTEPISISAKFCTVINTTKCPLWAIQTRASQIQDGGRQPSWKNRKNRHITETVRLTNRRKIWQDDAF